MDTLGLSDCMLVLDMQNIQFVPWGGLTVSQVDLSKLQLENAISYFVKENLLAQVKVTPTTTRLPIDFLALMLKF
jgi:hypothetical protein